MNSDCNRIFPGTKLNLFVEISGIVLNLVFTDGKYNVCHRMYEFVNIDGKKYLEKKKKIDYIA